MDYNSYRRESREVSVGNVKIGGRNPIAIQSMTNTDTRDVEATYKQVRALEEAGCDIVRLSVPDLESAASFYALKERGIGIPLVADIHFDYKIALEAINAGADKIRINPGNIGERARVEAVVRACRERNIPIRIGVNSGSLEKHILERYGAPTPEALAESALYHAEILESLDFYDTVISVKASDPMSMIRANRILAERTSYPLHLGVTEAGARTRAVVKSSVGVGTLLAEGIGDTLRISLTDNPVEEVAIAREILSSLDIGKSRGMDIVACPTCARTKINLISLLSQFEERVKAEGLDSLNIKVALMGCVVNGPGEARCADIGIAGGKGEGLLFKKGTPVRKISEDRLIDELIAEIKLMTDV